MDKATETSKVMDVFHNNVLIGTITHKFWYIQTAPIGSCITARFTGTTENIKKEDSELFDQVYVSIDHAARELTKNCDPDGQIHFEYKELGLKIVERRILKDHDGTLRIYPVICNYKYIGEVTREVSRTGPTIVRASFGDDWTIEDRQRNPIDFPSVLDAAVAVHGKML